MLHLTDQQKEKKNLKISRKHTINKIMRLEYELAQAKQLLANTEAKITEKESAK